MDLINNIIKTNNLSELNERTTLRIEYLEY